MQRYANMYKKVLTLARTHLLPPARNQVKDKRANKKGHPGGGREEQVQFNPHPLSGRAGSEVVVRGGKTIGENLALLENRNVH